MCAARSPALRLTRSLPPVLKCWHCDLPFEPTGVGFQLCSCSAGTLVRFSLSDSGQHLSCRREPGRGLTSGFEAPADSSRSVSASTGGSFPLGRWSSHRVSSCSRLSGPRFSKASSFTHQRLGGRLSQDFLQFFCSFGKPAGALHFRSEVSWTVRALPGAARFNVHHLIRDSGWHLKCLVGKGPTELGGPYLASAGAAHLAKSASRLQVDLAWSVRAFS